jgi:hypothetical protein
MIYYLQVKQQGHRLQAGEGRTVGAETAATAPEPNQNSPVQFDKEMLNQELHPGLGVENRRRGRAGCHPLSHLTEAIHWPSPNSRTGNEAGRRGSRSELIRKDEDIGNTWTRKDIWDSKQTRRWKEQPSGDFQISLFSISRVSLTPPSPVKHPPHGLGTRAGPPTVETFRRGVGGGALRALPLLRRALRLSPRSQYIPSLS